MFTLRPASAIEATKTASMLESIVAENPAHWPHGLTTGHFAPDNLWVLTKGASMDPAGFVGWQTRRVGGERVGYYSVGIAPEYRRHGLAKKAVSHVVDRMRPSVDRVEALVVKGNTPSEHLAGSLGVHVKQASPWRWAQNFVQGMGGWKPTAKAGLSNLLTGVGGAAMLDSVNYGNNGVVGEALGHGEADAGALNDAILNASLILTGKSMGKAYGKLHSQGLDPVMARLHANFGAAAGTALGGAGGQVTSALSAGSRAQSNSNRVMADMADSFRTGLGGLSDAIYDKEMPVPPAATLNMPPLEESTATKWGPYAIAAALLGAGGLAMYGSRNRGGGAIVQPGSKGTVKVTLPTRNAGDAETVIELPLNSPIVSTSLEEGLHRDVRRRLRHEVKSRTRTRNTRPMNEITHVE